MTNQSVSLGTGRQSLATVGVLITAALIVVALFVILPSASHAATYAYVNTSGTTVNVSANSPSEAFANSTNISEHSGVMLVSGSQVAGVSTVFVNQNQLVGYLYVNTSGDVTYVSANSSGEAFADSVNIASNSGVMLINSMEDSNMSNDQVASL